MNRATLEWMFSGDLRLVFDYPGYPNSHIGLISMNDTDLQKTQRYALILVNFGQGPDMTIQVISTPHDYDLNGISKDKLVAAGLGRGVESFYIKSVDELLQITENSYNKLGFPPHISNMGGGEGAHLISDESGIPYTQTFWFYPSVEEPTQTPSIPTATP